MPGDDDETEKTRGESESRLPSLHSIQSNLKPSALSRAERKRRMRNQREEFNFKSHFSISHAIYHIVQDREGGNKSVQLEPGQHLNLLTTNPNNWNLFGKCCSLATRHRPRMFVRSAGGGKTSKLSAPSAGSINPFPHSSSIFEKAEFDCGANWLMDWWMDSDRTARFPTSFKLLREGEAFVRDKQLLLSVPPALQCQRYKQ